MDSGCLRYSRPWNHTAWHLSSFPGHTFSRLIHMATLPCRLFLFIAQQYSIVWIYSNSFIHSKLMAVWAVSSLGLFWIRLLCLSLGWAGWHGIGPQGSFVVWLDEKLPNNFPRRWDNHTLSLQESAGCSTVSLTLVFSDFLLFCYFSENTVIAQHSFNLYFPHD